MNKKGRQLGYIVSIETRKKIGESTKGRIPWNKGIKTGHIPWNKGKTHSDETKRKIGLKSKISSLGNKSRTGMKNSPEHIEKNRQYRLGKKASLETRLKIANLRRGEKSPWWKGGLTPINKQIRKSEEYIKWRISVFERDNYTCQECKKRGGEIQADHIKPFSKFPELRFEITNGRTLCRPCHMKTPTFGGNSKKKLYAKH